MMATWRVDWGEEERKFLFIGNVYDHGEWRSPRRGEVEQTVELYVGGQRLARGSGATIQDALHLALDDLRANAEEAVEKELRVLAQDDWEEEKRSAVVVVRSGVPV